MVFEESGDEERCAEIGSCQGLKLTPLTNEEDKTEACYIAMHRSFQQATPAYTPLQNR